MTYEKTCCPYRADGIGEEVVDAEIFAADAEIPMDEQRESCKLCLPLGDKEYIFTPLSGDEAA